METKLLDFKIDNFRAATLDANSAPANNDEQFDIILHNTLNHLREVKARGVWLKLTLDQSTYIPIAVKYGFEFHHAIDDYMLLTQWLPENEVSKLPHYATHFVGVGGVVFNDETDEILVIQERVRLLDFDFWKLPGGLVDQGEYISQAVEREVFEETGIKAKFHSILSFREKLAYKYNQPDMYFTCLLKPETFDIKIDPQEIKAAKWMKVDEYLENAVKYGVANNFAKVIQLKTLKAIEKIKSLDEETFFGLTSFSGEPFTLKLGTYVAADNVLYSANVVNKVVENKPSL